MNTHPAILTRSWTAFPGAKVGDRIELTDDQLRAGRCADGDLYRLLDEEPDTAPPPDQGGEPDPETMPPAETPAEQPKPEPKPKPADPRKPR